MNIQPFRLLGAFLLVLAALALAACGSASPQRQASLALGIDAAQGEPVFFTDTHGGFHGDGLTYAELHFSGDACLLEIQQAPGWEALPLGGDLAALLYGGRVQDGLRGPLTGEDGQPLFPLIEEGYYYFEDRSPQSSGSQDTSQILARASLNFTLGIYDAQAQTLYYCEFDT